MSKELGDLGNLGVNVRATAEQFSADMKKVLASSTSTTDAIVTGWGKSANAAVTAVQRMEQKTAAKTILRDFESTTGGIVKGWAKTADAAQNAGVKTTRSFDQANAALKTLEQILGVNLPKATGDWIEKSRAIGPVLNAAFSGIAVLGLIQALTQLPALFDKISGAITGWDEKAKKAFAAVQEQTRKAIEVTEEYRLKLLEIQFGPQVSLKEAARTQTEEIAKQNKIIDEINAKLEKQKSIAKDLALINAQAGMVQGIPGLGAKDQAALDAAIEARRQANEQLVKLQRELNKEVLEQSVGDQKKATDKISKIKEDALRKDAAMQLAEQAAIFEDIAELTTRRFDADRRMQQMEQDAIFQDQAEAAERIHKMWVDDQKAMQEEITQAVMQGVEERERILDADRKMQKAEQDAIFDDQREAMDRSARAAEDAYQDAFRSVKDTARHAFLDILSEGKLTFEKLGGIITGIFRTIAAEILSTLTAQLFTPLIQKASASLGGLLGKIPGLGGAFGGAAGSGAGAAGGTAGGAGISGAALGAFFTNPITAAVGGAIAAAIAFTKSQAHHEANTFVQQFQNPFGKMLGNIVDSFNAAAAAGALTKEEGAKALEGVHELWDTFTQQAKEFAKGGSDEALVVKQAFQTLDPLLKQIFGDMEVSIQGLAANAVALEQATIAANLAAEELALTQSFVDRVVKSTQGADNLAQALLILESMGSPTAIILDRLGSDIEEFFNVLTLSGQGVPDLIQKYHDLIAAQESITDSTARLATPVPFGPFSRITASSAEEVRAFLAALGVNPGAAPMGDVYLDGQRVGNIVANRLHTLAHNMGVKVTGTR